LGISKEKLLKKKENIFGFLDFYVEFMKEILRKKRENIF